MAGWDSTFGWSLLIFCNALGLMFQEVETIVRDSPDGPGWSAVLDLDRCPDEWLPWLGQFAGVRVVAGSTPAQQRARIASTDGFRRGTRSAMIGAARATLTPPYAVVFRERDGDPYKLTVSTYTLQTPNAAATRAALLAQKPAGIVMTYKVLAGQDWQLLKDHYATWSDVKAHYARWSDVTTDQPTS